MILGLRISIYYDMRVGQVSKHSYELCSEHILLLLELLKNLPGEVVVIYHDDL